MYVVILLLRLHLFVKLRSKRTIIHGDKANLEKIITLPNFIFGQLCMCIGANNDQILLSIGQTSDFQQCSNRLQLDLISLFHMNWYK